MLAKTFVETYLTFLYSDEAITGYAPVTTDTLVTIVEDGFPTIVCTFWSEDASILCYGDAEGEYLGEVAMDSEIPFNIYAKIG